MLKDDIVDDYDILVYTIPQTTIQKLKGTWSNLFRKEIELSPFPSCGGNPDIEQFWIRSR